MICDLTNRRLHLIIMPTEACNFRCTYCYEDFAIGKMPDAVVDGIERLIARRMPELDRLDLSWFGGEPLAQRDTVYRVNGFAHDLAHRHGVAFTSNMTTNGYLLTAEVFDQCVASGIDQFHISLDGTPDVHDGSRRLANGHGTFARIWSNLANALASDRTFKLLLRLHYTRSTENAVGALARMLVDAYGSDPRLSFYFKDISRLGGPHDEAIEPLSEDEKAEIQARLSALVGGRNDPAADDEAVCYAAQPNSLVVRADGRLNKCTVALSSDFNQVGQITPEGDVQIDQQRWLDWVRPLLEGNMAEAACPLHHLADRAAAARPAAPSG